MLSTTKHVLVLTILLVNRVLSDIVKIDDGKIEGTVWKTRYNEDFHAFMKIPYAEPPLGDLRFQAPKTVKAWNDTLIATEFGPMCMQVNLLSNSPVSENCLHLNVFTKSLPSIEENSLKPVIAYVHGGAFQLGSASDHKPHLLMERDIVLVTINYRLGAFGFLSLGTKEIPGNAGWKDQVMALKWIKKNIANFGGNPNLVTLMGNSAGAFAATAHMVSPMSTGLFHRVIALSGTIAWQRKLEKDYLGLARRLAEKMNCTTTSNERMIECLRTVSLIRCSSILNDETFLETC